MSKTKILVTGSNGLLGQKLTYLLAPKESVQLVATSRGENRCLAPYDYTYEEMDVTNEEDVSEIIFAHNPDVIIHTAAMTNVDQCETDKDGCDKLNVNAVEYVVRAAEEVDAFLIHLSTDFIFDGEGGPYSEMDVPNPVSYYGESKLKAEKIVKDSELHWAIARTILVYGVCPGMSRSNIVLWVKDSIEKEKQLQIVDDQLRSPTLAEDLAMGCWLLADSRSEGVFNIGGKDFLTPYEMAMVTCDFFNLDKSFITKTDGSKFQQTAKRPPRTGLSIDKARTFIDYKPHSFEEGIKVMVDQLAEMEK